MAEKEWEEQDDLGRKVSIEATLQQTKKGAIFLHKVSVTEWWDEDAGEPAEKTRHECIPMTRDEANAWLRRGEVHIIDEDFTEFPEASAEPEQEAIIHLRIPPTLKQRAEQAASTAGMSSNAWAMRCIERCAGDKPEWILREPEIDPNSKETRIALPIAPGWPVAMLTPAQAAQLGRQLLKQVERSRSK